MKILNKVKDLIIGEEITQNKKYTSKQIPILKQQLTQILKENSEKDGVVVSLQGSWGDW